MAHQFQSEVIRETVEAGPQFDELLELGIETMLSDRSVFDVRHNEISHRTRLAPKSDGPAQSLGLWAVGTALKEGIDIDGDLVEELQSYPQILLPADPAIQDKIEAFGQAILDEAFECLGPDAPDYIEKLKQAATIQEYMEVCNWLTRRLDEIKIASKANSTEQETEQDEEASNTDREYFYHPGRLSPKFIGAYPDTQVEPTCLSYSILTASFFEKAGVPYVHAGVGRTAKEDINRFQDMMIFLISRTAKNSSLTLPINLQETFDATDAKNRKKRGDHRGFHATILAAIGDEGWLQMDQNYERNILMTSFTAREVGQAYEKLIAENDIARGLEHDFMPNGIYEHELYINLAVELIEQLPDLKEADEFLRTLPADTALSDIISKYFSDFFEDSDTSIGKLVKRTFGTMCTAYNLSLDRAAQDVVHTILEKYVFPDSKNGDLITSIERCHRDPAYRQRRAEALVLGPLFATLRMQSVHGSEIAENMKKAPHSAMEGGMPAYRIGACVLSDLAVYCGDELPLSFWMTYWPSIVAFSEHAKNAKGDSQKELKRQLMPEVLDELYLKYFTISGIIDIVHE